MSDTRGVIAVAVLEIVALFGVFLGIAASLLGVGSFLSTWPVPVRLLVLVFVGLEVLIPLWMLVDIHRQPAAIDAHWLHTVLIPVFNVFGFAAYRWKRAQVQESNASAREGTE